MKTVDYEANRAKWLYENGFNDAEVTYVYFPDDSYAQKENLKDAGFRFNPSLFWHIDTKVEAFADKLIEIKLSEVAEMTAWGRGLYDANAKKYVEAKMIAARPVVISNSEWVGVEKERLRDIPAKIISIREVETKFGLTNLIVFEDTSENKYQWWTSTNIEREVGENILLTGTVKTHNEYKGVKYTTLNRCKLV